MVVTLHHIFTHDMRWNDNKALLEGLKCSNATKVKGWICLDPTQLDLDGPYTGVPAIISFLMACKSLLDDQTYALGSIEVRNCSIQSLADSLLSTHDPDTVWVSCAKQYTPFAQARQSQLTELFGPRFICVDDHSLLSPDTLASLKPNKKENQYLVFSPFYRLATQCRDKWNPIRYPRSVQRTSTIHHKGTHKVTSLLSNMKQKWKPRTIFRTTRKLGL